MTGLSFLFLYLTHYLRRFKSRRTLRKELEEAQDAALHHQMVQEISHAKWLVSQQSLGEARAKLKLLEKRLKDKDIHIANLENHILQLKSKTRRAGRRQR